VTDISAADQPREAIPLAVAHLVSEASVGDFVALMKPRVMSLVVFTLLGALADARR
jgi:heme O synthase-like polyprenyltransferase